MIVGRSGPQRLGLANSNIVQKGTQTVQNKQNRSRSNNISGDLTKLGQFLLQSKWHRGKAELLVRSLCDSPPLHVRLSLLLLLLLHGHLHALLHTVGHEPIRIRMVI